LKALENETDERLLIEAAQQDPAHFAELYENNFERVYAYIAHRVQNREEAQDLAAEVFHQALASITSSSSSRASHPINGTSSSGALWIKEAFRKSRRSLGAAREL